MLQKTSLFMLSLVVIYGLKTALAVPANQGLRLFPHVVMAGEDQRANPGAAALAAEAPILATDIRIDVSGPIARTRVRQLFVNPGDQWMEGVYTFPLPEDAAVDAMRMVIGDRVIQGVIREREAARKSYERAKRAGKRAGLITQERPNVFTTSIANIGPGVQIAIEIEFQEVLRLDQGTYALRFPTVLAPRYIPGRQPIVGVGGLGRSGNTRKVPDAERITPPVRHPEDGPINPLVFQIQLDAGGPIERLWSVSHEIESVRKAGAYEVALKRGAVPADRDFVLEWRRQATAAPVIDLFKESRADGTYLLALIQPPPGQAQVPTAPPLPREVVFVVDTSGSMAGVSLAGAKSALAQAVKRLPANARFNIIRFSDHASALYPAPVAADAAAKREAGRFVDGLTSDGGTEFIAALDLSLDGRIDQSRLRQIVFLTDGAVGNEAQILAKVRRELGDSRLFTIGIGSAPNGYLMRKAAEFGRGTYSYIENEAQVAGRMTALFRKLEAPVLGDLEVLFSADPAAEVWPGRLPDLYRGEPILLSGKLSNFNGEMTLAGSIAAAPWKMRLPLSAAKPGVGIAKQWAAMKIAGLMDRRHEGVAKSEVREAVLEVALEHGLLSRFTSLVAIEMAPVRPLQAALRSAPLATNLPHGWVFDKVFGPPAGGSGGLLKKASAVGAKAAGRSAMLRARGATPAGLHLLAGLALLLTALVCFLLSRRRQRAAA